MPAKNSESPCSNITRTDFWMWYGTIWQGNVNAWNVFSFIFMKNSASSFKISWRFYKSTQRIIISTPLDFTISKLATLLGHTASVFKCSVANPKYSNSFVFWGITRRTVVRNGCFATTYQSHLQGLISFFLDSLPQMAPTASPETSVSNLLTPRNNIYDEII